MIRMPPEMHMICLGQAIESVENILHGDSSHTVYKMEAYILDIFHKISHEQD